jgi:hypothetical protein
VKNKRAQYEEEHTEQYTKRAAGSEKDFTPRRDARASTYTVGSIEKALRATRTNSSSCLALRRHETAAQR